MICILFCFEMLPIQTYRLLSNLYNQRKFKKILTVAFLHKFYIKRCHSLFFITNVLYSNISITQISIILCSVFETFYTYFLHNFSLVVATSSYYTLLSIYVQCVVIVFYLYLFHQKRILVQVLSVVLTSVPTGQVLSLLRNALSVETFTILTTDKWFFP